MRVSFGNSNEHGDSMSHHPFDPARLMLRLRLGAAFLFASLCFAFIASGCSWQALACGVLAIAGIANAPRLARLGRAFGNRLRTNAQSSVAVVALTALVLTLSGCTPGQKQTTLQVITAVNAKLPEVTAAADTVAATIAALAPADAALIAVCDTGFDTVAKTLQALTASYIANPNASTLAQIQAAINTLESSINTATLNVVGIKDAASQRLALAALKGLLTVVTVVFAMLAPTQTTAQLLQLRETNTIHLAQVRPYMDEPALQRAATETGVDLNAAFHRAEAFGF